MYIEVSYDGKHIEKVNFPSDIYYIFTHISHNFFRVPINFLYDWNTFIEEEWYGLDSCDFYNNVTPIVNGDDWHYYNGSVSTAEEYLELAKTMLNHAETFLRNTKGK